VAVVVVVLLAGELAPRAFARRGPVRLALVAAPFLRTGSRVLGRLLFPLTAVVRLISRRSGRIEASADELQVREALEIGADEGVVEADEHRLIERAFKLDELNAWDAMTPRVDIVALKDARLLGEILPELEDLPHSRVPVYGESIDDVTGIMHVRDAYRAYVAGQRDTPLSKLARPPMFVPGSLSLAKLLADFRARRVHMGIVADAFWGTDGLITLEDVLEELVGEIVDEYDTEPPMVEPLEAGVFLVDARLPVDDLAGLLDTHLPDGEWDTVGGLVLGLAGRVPIVGERFEFDGAVLIPERVQGRRVERVRVSHLVGTQR